jgi:hypothetical protein
MLMDLAVRIHARLAPWQRWLNAIAWVCVALVTADYARFIDLPVLFKIPLWAGIAFNFLRWGVWEGMVKPRLEAQATASAAAEPES